jgi:hypothetical protein
MNERDLESLAIKRTESVLGALTMAYEFKTTRERWGYDPNFVRCQAIDDAGEALSTWFEPVASHQIVGWHLSGRRLVTLLTLCAGLATLMAVQTVQQVLSAG